MGTTRQFIGLALALSWSASLLLGQSGGFDGLNMGLSTLSRLSHAKTRSISPENFTGEKGERKFLPIGHNLDLTLCQMQLQFLYISNFLK